MNQKSVITAYRLIQAIRELSKLIDALDGDPRECCSVMVSEAIEDGDTIAYTDAGIPKDLLVAAFRDVLTSMQTRLGELGVTTVTSDPA